MSKKPETEKAAPTNAPVPSSLSLWLEDALPGWVVPAALGAVIVGGATLYIFDFLPERITALALAIGISLFATGFIAKELLVLAHNGMLRGLTYLAVLVVFCLTLGPAVMSIVPGVPLYETAITKVGDTLTLPQGVDGRLRLLVQGKLGGAGPAELAFELEGAKEPVVGKLERTQSTSRAGRRGTMTSTHDHDADFLSAVVPAGTQALKIVKLEGPLAGELTFKVYRDHLPLAVDLGMALVALALVAWLAARQHVKTSAGAIAGLALGYGVLSELWVTPNVAVRTQIGALIIAALAGSVVGMVFAATARKLVARQDA